MRRLDRYLVGETLLPFGIGAAAAVMLLTGGLLAEFGPLLLDRKVGMLAVLQLLLFRLPFLLVIATPVATAVGTAMAVSRLARDQEVLVMRMAGVSVRRIFLPYIVMGLAMFGLTYWFQEAVVPGSGSAFKQLFFRISLMQSQPSLAPNTVLRVREFIFCLGFVQQRSERVFEVQEVTAFRPKGVKAGALSQEFSRMLRDLRAGLPRAEALKRMAERMDIPQISNFTSALIQADRVGANLSDTLRSQANQRREERFLRAEKLALEAPVKMMLPLVMFFFPLIFLFIGYFIYLKMIQEGIL